MKLFEIFRELQQHNYLPRNSLRSSDLLYLESISKEDIF